MGMLVPLAACASTAAGEVELPAQDRARWVMPLDQFQSASAGPLSNYAENLLVADCLGEEGISWPIPWQPTDDASYLEPPANASGFPALTASLASEYGYRARFNPGAWSGQSPEALTELNSIASSTPGFEPLSRACLDEARERVPHLAVNESSNRLTGWMYEAYQTAYTAPRVVEASARWQQCLNDAGYASVPAAPADADAWMPSESLLEEVAIPNRYGEGDGAPESELTQQEIDLAVADATCRESSGWSEAIYQAAWDAQADLVTKHADELVRIRDEWDDAREIVLAVVAAHAPEQ